MIAKQLARGKKFQEQIQNNQFTKKQKAIFTETETCATHYLPSYARAHLTAQLMVTMPSLLTSCKQGIDTYLSFPIFLLFFYYENANRFLGQKNHTTAVSKLLLHSMVDCDPCLCG